MKHGLRTHQATGKINYKQLRKINPEAARRAVLEYLKTNNHNISEAAYIFGINRTVVYDIINKESEGDLKDRARVPKHQPRRTPVAIEDKVIEVKNKTRRGPAVGYLAANVDWLDIYYRSFGNIYSQCQNRSQKVM